MANLITLAEYKTYMGIDTTDDRDDTRITALLGAATRMVRQYTGRSFDVSTGTASARAYQYDGSTILDIDDCSAVTAVATDAGVAGQSYNLTTDQWTLMPQDDSDVFYYMLILGGPYFGASPEMGFERNLDRIGILTKDPIITVTGTWGWPTVPEDVKLATAWTVGEAMARQANSSEAVSAEAIAGFSRSWGGRAGGATALAIPNRARDLLAGYQRLNV